MMEPRQHPLFNLACSGKHQRSILRPKTGRKGMSKSHAGDYSQQRQIVLNQNVASKRSPR